MNKDLTARAAKFSGEVELELPRSLHYRLHMLAQEEGVSLNDLMVYLLSPRPQRTSKPKFQKMRPSHYGPLGQTK